MAEEKETVGDSESGLGEIVLAGLRAAGVPIVDGIKIPGAVMRNLGKAVTQLCAIPNAMIQSKVAEIMATTEARVAFIKATGKVALKGIDLPSELVAQGSEREARRILRQQRNVSKVLEVAVSELRTEPYLREDPVAEISDDWINMFEREAEMMSSTEMQLLFGKILAGEISRPSSYSKRTLRLLSELDPRAAGLFKALCSVAVVGREGDRIDSAQVPALDDDGIYLLHNYGVSYDGLLLLQECGLIAQSNAISFDYTDAFRKGEDVEYCGVKYKVHSTTQPLVTEVDGAPFYPQVVIPGISFSTAGRELYDIVDKVENSEYTVALQSYLNGRFLNMTPVQAKAAVALP